MADASLKKEKQDAIKLLAASAGTLAIPPSVILPFQNLLQNTELIKQKEAQRMFPGADPNIFNKERGFYTPSFIPVNQYIANTRIFDKQGLSVPEDLYEKTQTFPTFLTAKPDAPSPELGSYQQAIANKTIFPEGDIQAITVTPSPNPSRFAQDYAEILADKLGKAHIDYEQFLSPTGTYYTPKNADDVEEAINNNQSKLKKLTNKIEVLSDKTPGTAGYVWGNIDEPQYSYAEGNWGLGQKFSESNPSIYISRINADPSKEAKYLYTGDILQTPYKDPRVRFNQFEDLGPATGPSWGLGARNDISFRKDLIGARGELTVGDLQSLLAERNLPFDYQSLKDAAAKGRTYGTKRPGDVLRTNLEALAAAENITPHEAIEKFARLVPNVGEPVTPATQAVIGRESSFSVEGPGISPFGQFAAKTDLRQLGILPPSDKAIYSPFTINEFEYLNQKDAVVPAPLKGYGAKTIKSIDTYTAPVNPDDVFGEMLKNKLKVEINRDALRPVAATKLLNKTVANLIEQSKPIQGLGLGGFATGAIATAMDPAVINAVAQGDYMQAGTTAAVNTAVGSAVGGATAKGLQALRAAGYARPAAMIGSALPLGTGVLAGLGAVEAGKALNRAYRTQTGKDWVTRNQPANPYSTYTGPTPTIQPRMGTAILNGAPVQVPYGSVAGTKPVGRPWWDQVGSRIQKFADLLNRGSIVGR